MQWYWRVLKNYAVFSGRARRKEYWVFYLFNVLITLALFFLEAILKGTAPTDDEPSILATLYELGIMLPSLAVGVRRMHDTNRSGWWYLVPIANFIFAVTAGDPGANRYGLNPKHTVS